MIKVDLDTMTAAQESQWWFAGWAYRVLIGTYSCQIPISMAVSTITGESAHAIYADTLPEIRKPVQPSGGGEFKTVSW